MSAFMESALPRPSNPELHTTPEEQVSWRDAERRLERIAEAKRRAKAERDRKRKAERELERWASKTKLNKDAI